MTAFDRPSDEHPLGTALQDLEQDSQPTHRCLAENWRMDHRVSEQREDEILAFPQLSAPKDGEAFLTGTRSYFEQRLVRPTIALPGQLGSAYLEDPNASNAIRERALLPSVQLLHGESLNGLLGLAARIGGRAFEARLEARTGALPFGRGPGGAASSAALRREVDALAERLKQQGPEAIREIAGLLCSHLGPGEPPWWATFAADVHPLVEAGDAAGLCRGLGLGHLEAGEWLLLWRYEVGQVQARAGLGQPAFYRPTVAEARDSGFHYPSPPGCAYGITMPLGSSSVAYQEVLHPPLRGPLATSACTGHLLRIEEMPLADHANLPSLRQRHGRRLQRQWSQREADTKAWLERHGTAP